MPIALALAGGAGIAAAVAIAYATVAATYWWEMRTCRPAPPRARRPASTVRTGADVPAPERVTVPARIDRAASNRSNPLLRGLCSVRLWRRRVRGGRRRRADRE
ncbi:hypothetical protein [Nocardia africana]